MDFNMVGPLMVLSLSSIGSSMGCYIAGAASHAAMSRVEEGHGKFIGMSAAPASVSIYGFILITSAVLLSLIYSYILRKKGNHSGDSN